MFFKSYCQIFIAKLCYITVCRVLNTLLSIWYGESINMNVDQLHIRMQKPMARMHCK